MMLLQQNLTPTMMALLLLVGTISVVEAGNWGGRSSGGTMRRRLESASSSSMNLPPAVVGHHGRGLAEVPPFGDGSENFEFVKTQVEEISPRTGRPFGEEDQIPLPFTMDTSAPVEACEAECESEYYANVYINVEAGLVMNTASCKEGCVCAGNCGEDQICIARCQSTYNGYVIEPSGVLDEADVLAECQFGELGNGLGVVGACSTVTSDFPGVNCALCSKLLEDLIPDRKLSIQTCPLETPEYFINLCECETEAEECRVPGPFCDDEGPFTDPPCDRSGGSNGDPHFKTWAGKWYDYSGECDLHLLYAPNFGLELMMDLTIDIRTTVRYDYSYIESAVVVIGNSSFEVSSFGAYALDGVSMADLPNTIAGFPIRHSVPDYDKGRGNTHTFTIEVDGKEAIILSTYKDLVSVKVDHADSTRFSDSYGMMGDFTTGTLFGKDGVTKMSDPDMLAKEWQVKDDEPMLFSNVRAPQYPQECILPDPIKTTKRRLGETAVNLDAARAACASWAENKDGCVHDVMAMGDLDAASSGGL